MVADKSNQPGLPGTSVSQSNDLFCRVRFLFECSFFDSSLASFAARVGFVGLRFRGTTSARRTSSARRSSARSRLRLWLRMSLATTRMLPSVVSRDASLSSNRVRCSSLSARDPVMLQKISTRDDVLLTCCPPAPDDLDTLTSSSLRGIESESLTARIFPDAGGGESLTSSPPAEQLECGEERQKSPHENDQQLWSHSR
jgi:hypothetical protein